MPAFCAKIRPFHDRLDIEQEWIFYSVPVNSLDGPTTVFTDRFWDHRERWIPPGVGTVPGTETPYFGPVPAAGVTALHGTPDQWLNGFSYQDFIDGKYPTIPCCGAGCGPAVRIRQAQAVTMRTTKRPWIGQAQTVTAGDPPTVATDCCPGVGLPTALQARFNEVDEPCWHGVTIPLLWDGTAWVGTGTVGTCGYDLTLTFWCDTSGGPGLEVWKLHALASNGCVNSDGPSPFAGSTCTPFKQIYILGSGTWIGACSAQPFLAGWIQVEPIP